MENRKRLHDYGLCLVILTVCDIFNLITGFLAGFFDGSFEEGIANAPADVAPYIKPVLFGIVGFFVILTAAQLLIGIKGLKVSKTPSAAKGYISAAILFMILNVIALVIDVVNLSQESNPDVFNAITSIAIIVVDVCVYVIFISAAKKVRKDFLKGAK